MFVALAGFGFGMLSDSAAPEWSPPVQDTAAPAPAVGPIELAIGASDAATARRTDHGAGGAATGRRPRGASVGAADQPRCHPTVVVPTRALPLPPPPKARFAASRHRGQRHRDRQRGMRRADAAIVPALADESEDHAASASSEADGTRGPFQPLFAKLPASHAAGGQVLVQYVADAAGGPATAMHLVRQLRAAGFSVEARAVQFSIRANSIRYFFPDDRDEAEALRASLEGQRRAAPRCRSWISRPSNRNRRRAISRSGCAPERPSPANRRHQQRQLPDNAGGGAERGVPEGKRAHAIQRQPELQGRGRPVHARWQTGAQRAV